MQPALTLDCIFPLLRCKMAPDENCPFRTALADARLCRDERAETFLRLQMF